jgi:hypothetical protein
VPLTQRVCLEASVSRDRDRRVACQTPGDLIGDGMLSSLTHSLNAVQMSR